MIESRTNGLIPRRNWKPVDMKAALWRGSLTLGESQISVEEYKSCKRPHWPPVDRIIEWGDGDWNQALVQANLNRSRGSRYYPIDAMEALHKANKDTSGYLDTKTFADFLRGSQFPSHGTCECTLAGTFNKLRYFCGFWSKGNLLMSDEEKRG